MSFIPLGFVRHVYIVSTFKFFINGAPNSKELAVSPHLRQ